MANITANFVGLQQRIFLGFTLVFTAAFLGIGYWANGYITHLPLQRDIIDRNLILMLTLVYVCGLALIYVVSVATLAPIRQLLRAAQGSDQSGAAPPDFDRLAQRRFPDEISALARIFRERQQMHAALRDSEQKFQSLLEHTTDGILLVDETGQIVEWNQAMEALTGIAQARALGQPALDIQALMNPGLDRERVAQLLATVKRDGCFPPGSAPREWRLRPLNNEERVIEENPFVIPMSAQFMIGSISRDITERNNAQQQIQQLNAELEQRVRERTRKLEATIEQLRQEVSERQRAEAALRESEARYRTLVEISPDAIILTDLAGHLLMANSQALALFGFQPQDNPFGADSFDFIAPQDRQRARANMGRPHHVQRHGIIEYELRRRDGTQFAGELSVSLVSDAAGRPQGYTGIVRDITKRKSAEAMQLQYQAELEMLARASQAFNSTLDLDEILTTVLDEVRHSLDAIACSIWLTDPVTGEIVCRQASGPQNDLVRGWRVPPGQGIVGWVIEHGEGVNLGDVQTDLRHYTGVDQKTELPLRSMLAVPLHGRQGNVGVIEVANMQVGHFNADDLAFLKLLAFAAVSAIENAGLYEQAQREIVQRTRAEETLSAANQRLRALSVQLVEVQENERRQLALELHDELGQMLNSIKLSLDLVPTDLASESQESLRRAKRLIGQLIQQVRQLALNLRPAMLDDLGLVPALKSLFRRQTSQTGLQINFENNVSDSRRFSPAIETAAYRIVQEGVTNATRHAQIDCIRVELLVNDSTLSLAVCDQGKGFALGALPTQPASTGLTGMRERARLLGGDLIIDSAPGSGTRLYASLPLT